MSARAIGRIASLEHRPLEPELDHRCVRGLLRRQAIDLPDADGGRKNLAQMAAALLPDVPSQIHTASGEHVEGDIPQLLRRTGVITQHGAAHHSEILRRAPIALAEGDQLPIKDRPGSNTSKHGQ